ncbi:MAG: hypothetical protein FHK80_13920 [Azoarcus sp. PHD]|nr:MAG: hypothetical protein FHK80_13920 [Azoarcus sp. PHD]
MDINQEARARIIAAASQLYEQGGRTDFPTVGAVRQQAKVDMNAASVVMKEWRRMQTATPAPVAAAVPDRLRQAQDAALASLWGEAQEIANEALMAAQASWDIERAEAETLRAELSSAFESQAGELTAANSRIAELERVIEQAAIRADDLARDLEDMTNAKLAAENRGALAEQRAEEIEHRADDLKSELDRAHQDVDRLRAERDEAIKECGQVRHDAERQLHAADAKIAQAQDAATSAAGKIDALRDELATMKAERTGLEREAEQIRAALADQKQASQDAAGDRDRVRAELTTLKAKAEAADQAHQEQRKAAAQEAHRVAERMTKAEADRDTARKEASAAREDAANLRGQLEALQTQQAEVMRLLAERDKPGKTPK